MQCKSMCICYHKRRERKQMKNVFLKKHSLTPHFDCLPFYCIPQSIKPRISCLLDSDNENYTRNSNFPRVTSISKRRHNYFGQHNQLYNRHNSNHGRCVRCYWHRDLQLYNHHELYIYSEVSGGLLFMASSSGYIEIWNFRLIITRHCYKLVVCVCGEPY